MITVKRSCTRIGAKRITPMIEGAKLQFNNGVIKWHIGNFTNDMEKHEQVLVLKDVFRHYEFENYPLRYDSTSNANEAAIKIYFVSSDGWIYIDGVEKFECPDKLDNEILAIAYAPYGGKWQGYAFINDNLFWALRKDAAGKHLLFDTLVHELGHTHNMDHSTNKDDLMYYMEGSNQVWGSDSINLLFTLYKDERVKALQKSISAMNFFIHAKDKIKTNGQQQATTNGCFPIILYLFVVLIALITGFYLNK